MTEQLTREQVMAMEPGRELDSLVEHEVIGTRRPAKGWSINPRHYSTDISAAWEVVEKMQERYLVRISTSVENKWRVQFSPYDYTDAYCENAPEAITKASLLAVMGL